MCNFILFFTSLSLRCFMVNIPLWRVKVNVKPYDFKKLFQFPKNSNGFQGIKKKKRMYVQYLFRALYASCKIIILKLLLTFNSSFWESLMINSLAAFSLQKSCYNSGTRYFFTQLSINAWEPLALCLSDLPKYTGISWNIFLQSISAWWYKFLDESRIH